MPQDRQQERRQHLRVYWASPVSIVTASGQRVEGKTIDVSLGGFRFTSDTQLKAGEQMTTILRLLNGTHYPVEGTIRFIRDKGPYQYGVAFSLSTIEQLVEGIQANRK